MAILTSVIVLPPYTPRKEEKYYPIYAGNEKKSKVKTVFKVFVEYSTVS